MLAAHPGNSYRSTKGFRLALQLTLQILSYVTGLCGFISFYKDQTPLDVLCKVFREHKQSQITGDGIRGKIKKQFVVFRVQKSLVEYIEDMISEPKYVESKEKLGEVKLDLEYRWSTALNKAIVMLGGIMSAFLIMLSSEGGGLLRKYWYVGIGEVVLAIIVIPITVNKYRKMEEYYEKKYKTLLNIDSSCAVGVE